MTTVYSSWMFSFVIVGLCTHLFASTNYYVDSLNGNDAWTGVHTNNIPAGTGPWQSLSKVNGSTFLPGDSVLFKRGESWNGDLIIPSSGVFGNPIVYGAYGTGTRPLFNAGDSYNECILVKDDADGDPINYVIIREFDLMHGINDAFYIDGHAGAGGDGYTIEVRNVHVLVNWDGDGFSMGSSAGSTAQAVFYDISATKCRAEDSSGSRSDQALTLHQYCKARVYGAHFYDCNFWYTGVQNSYLEIHNLTASNALLSGLVVNGDTDPGAGAVCVVSNSTLVVDGSGGIGGAENGIENQVIIMDSDITITGGKLNFIKGGTLKLVRNSITVNSTANRIAAYKGGVILLEGNTITNINTSSPMFWAYKTDPGATIKAERNVFVGLDFSDTYFDFANTNGGGGYVRNNIFKNTGAGASAIKISAGCFPAPTIENNTFFNSTSGGKGIDNNGVAIGNTLDIHNNIFYGVTTPIDDTIRLNASHNCYFNLAGWDTGSNITNNPQFVDIATADLRLSLGSPCIDKGINLLNVKNDIVGAIRPLDGDGDGIKETDIGAYEYRMIDTVVILE